MKRVRGDFLPPIAIDRHGAVPIHRQLHDWFRDAIHAGLLPPGTPVPSTRALAAAMGVSRAPVLSAVEQLVADGYLQTFRGAGTCVADRLARPTPLSDAIGAQVSPRPISQAAARLASLGMAARPRNVGAFRAGVPALDRFPLGTWSRLVAAHARRSGAELMDYGDPMGSMPLREALAGYLGAARAVRCAPAQIIVVSSVHQALQMTARVLIDPGDPVWIEDPGYYGARKALTFEGARLVPAPVDGDGLDVAAAVAVCPGARAAYVTPAHQYPTGVSLSPARRVQLLDWASRSGSWIIEDDYDGEYRFEGRPLGALQGLDRDGRVIYVGTFSKVLFPALRLAYVVVPPDLVEPFRAYRSIGYDFTPQLPQAALADFIVQGHLARHVRRMHRVYAARREALVDALTWRLGDRLEVVGAEAGLHLTALITGRGQDRPIAEASRTAGLMVMPLSTEFLGERRRQGLVLGYASADETQLRRGVEMLAGIVEAAERGDGPNWSLRPAR